ncbi:MAG: hypothetical protein ACPGJU_00235 [Coraliomargarita sp.]
MKAIVPLFFLSASLAVAAATKIELGITQEAAVEALGKPVGDLILRDKTILLYPQGEITIEDGKVTHIDLMTDDEFNAHQETLRVERENHLQQQAEAKAAYTAQGEAAKTAKLQDGAFTAKPAKERVDYWRKFQRQYPTVDVSKQIENALADYQKEIKELKDQEKIAALEIRVAQAEKEAAAARLETEKLRKEAERLRQQQNYGLRYYTDPVPYYRNYYYRPPTVIIHSNGNKVTLPSNKSKKGFQ